MRAASPQPFHGRLVRHELGPLQVLRLSADASAARRTDRLVHASDPENVEVMLQLGGACAITQDDRASLIAEGDLGCWHSSAPYVVAADAAFDSIILTCPSALLARAADRFRRNTATRVDGATGLGRIVRRHLLELNDVLDEGDCPERIRTHLAEGLVDLIRAFHAGDGPATTRDRSRRLRQQIDEYIDANLSRPGLSRAVIAHDNFVSVSYLDRLYAGDEAGVWSTVQSKRLDRVRRDLADPALADESIFGIGACWGFKSPSHLSRAFRAMYGRTPTAYRTAALRRG